MDTGIVSDRTQILNRLIILRALALSCFVLYVAAFDRHTTSLFTIAILFLLSGGFSWVSWYRARTGKAISSLSLLVQLIWDATTTLIFVYMVGGSTNPFIYYLLVGVAISAGVLGEKQAWLYCFIATTAYSLLMYSDIGQHMAHMDSGFLSHLIGMWVNFVASAILICFFISRLTLALKARERSLSLAREEILKNEQLIGIGTLAATTVHSFGTPLSTIAMASAEINALHNDEDTNECTDIIRAQITRCKDTMQKLSTLANSQSASLQNVELQSFITELEEHFVLVNASPIPLFTYTEQAQGQYLPGGMLLLHAIINLIENAITAAKSQVKITFSSNSDSVIIIIEDDGKGMPPEYLQNFGEAIIASNTGLGIGFLLANSTIERLGGSVRFSNPNLEEATPMTRVSISLPKILGE